MARKTVEKPIELLTPPSSHQTVERFMKDLGLKQKAGRAAALAQLAAAATSGERGTTGSCYSSDDSYSESESSEDFDAEPSDAEASSERSARFAKRGTVLVLGGDDSQMSETWQSRQVLRDVCDMLSRETGSVEKGLDVAAAALASQTLLGALLSTSIKDFVASKAESKQLGMATERQWCRELQGMTAYFSRLERGIPTFKREGTKDPLLTAAYPLWLLETLFSLKDRQQVARRIVMPKAGS